jgi:hypothetical protein
MPPDEPTTYAIEFMRVLGCSENEAWFLGSERCERIIAALWDRADGVLDTPGVIRVLQEVGFYDLPSVRTRVELFGDEPDAGIFAR